MTRATKVVPPPVPPGSIARPALDRRLEEALHRRLTTVVAGAGFGKSTLLARWGASAGCAWYTLDRRDAAVSILAAGLVEALRARVPDLPPELTAAPETRASHVEERSWAEAFAARLSEGLQERLQVDLALVLDDLQEVGAASASVRLIESLSRHAPARLHLVLSSRAEIPFPIQRLRGRGEVLDLDPAVLAFTAEEVRDLVREALGEHTGDLGPELHAMTGGWPAAVRLAVEALRNAPPERADAVLEGLRVPGSPLFSYLAEEIFAREPGAVRELLRRAAHFERFTPDLCEAAGVQGAARTISALVRRGLFVQAQEPPGWYALHTLVREFALEHWPLGARALQSLHRRAAAWLEAHGHLDEALHSLAAAADAPGIARLLAERGSQLVAAGAVESVVRLAGQLPPGERDGRIELLLGEAHSVLGNATEALACFQRAAGDADLLPPPIAWRMARIHLDRGELEQTLRIHERTRPAGTELADEAFLLSTVATAHMLLGDRQASRAAADRAFQAARASGQARALAVAHAVLMLEALGWDPESADAHYRAALEAAEASGDVLQNIRIRTNRAVQLSKEGDYREAIAELDAALRMAELAGYAQRVAQSLVNRGAPRFSLGRLEEAVDDFESARAIYRRLGFRNAPWPVASLAMVFRERGDLALARALAEEALGMAERSGDVQARIDALVNLALLLAREDPDEAARKAEQAVVAGRSFGLLLVDALVAAGWVALARGERERAADLAAEAMEEARARRARPGMVESLELLALSGPETARVARLEEALAMWLELENPLGEARVELALARLSGEPLAPSLASRATTRLRALGVRPQAAAGAGGLLGSLPPEEPHPVEIRTLGGFQVLREGQPVPVAAWRSKKARDLLKILIARRGRPTPREVLMDILWPDEPPDKLSARLSVLVTTGRTVLDPERHYPSEHFIAADDAAVRVELAHLPVDVERFLREAETGFSMLKTGEEADARDVLALAEASYSGDFLEEDLYEEWATPLREEARARYVSVARALARGAHAARDWDAAVRYRLRILQRDAYDEEAHMGLVSTLAEAGRHGEALRAYRAYVARMEELGVEPAPFPDTVRAAAG